MLPMLYNSSDSPTRFPDEPARLGMADEMIGRHLDAANRGSTFLLIRALSDAEAERVMKVVRRVPFDLAHRYHRFAIEEVK